jgi:hypothetical protein
MSASSSASKKRRQSAWRGPLAADATGKFAARRCLPGWSICWPLDAARHSVEPVPRTIVLGLENVTVRLRESTRPDVCRPLGPRLQWATLLRTAMSWESPPAGPQSFRDVEKVLRRWLPGA